MIVPKSSKNYHSVESVILKTKQVDENGDPIFYDSANTKI